MQSATPWSAQQLTEFLASVSVYTDEARALRGAVERASEAFEAEAAAIVVQGVVVASVGFPADRTPTESLIAAGARHLDTIEVVGVGACHVLTVSFEVQGDQASLILARSGCALDKEEVSLLRSMARVLSLTLNNLRIVGSLRNRQALLEKLSGIQRLISTRVPLDDVLDAITKGMADMLSGDMVMLYFLDENDTVTLNPSFVVGRGRELPAPAHHIGKGAVGRSVAEDELIVIEHYQDSPDAVASALDVGVGAVMAAPVHEHGQVIGSLVVSSQNAQRSYSAAERDLLRSFAEHASLAVTDAKTVNALQEAVGDALHKALHDPLTGLSNRTRFLDRLDHALAVRRRPGVEVAVLYVDIDDFKLINDRFGNAAGDRLLVDVAGRLIGSVRGGDTVARLGGDEFAVLLEHASGPADAQQGASRILDAFRPSFTVAHTNVQVSASVGIAMAGAVGVSSDEALRNADVAMYRAKNIGKGCVVVFEPGMYESLLDRIELEADLRQAVEHEAIEAYFQPIVDLEAQRVVGVEALARWCHPARGFVPPAVFIQLAEETGLIMDLGRQILHRACSWIGAWHRDHQDEPPLYVAVNVSARQLQDPGFIDDVAHALAKGRVPPSSLVLEITESVLLQDAEGTLARLEALRRLGIRLALDDFGTGYSSLSYLRRFPVDLLKIDRSFVEALGARAEVPLIIEAIITLGDALGLDTVAEGVEQVEELAALRNVGCRLAQGFYFAKPMPVEALNRFLNGSELADHGAFRRAG